MCLLDSFPKKDQYVSVLLEKRIVIFLVYSEKEDQYFQGQHEIKESDLDEKGNIFIAYSFSYKEKLIRGYVNGIYISPGFTFASYPLDLYPVHF